VAAAVIPRYRFEDLRRFASAIGAAAGLPPPRSLNLASHLLWFDAAGAPTLGIATLPDWLEAIEHRRVDPMATGRVVSERTALAVFEGENGVAPLILGRAAEVAVEKAREAAVGLVRISGVGRIPSSAPVAAGIAIGPMAGWVLGPGRCWSLALPSQGGLPLVVDSGLSEIEMRGKPAAAGGSGRRPSHTSKATAAGRDGTIPASALLEGFWLGTEVLVPEGDWLVAAVSVPAMEPLATWHARLAAIADRMSSAPGRLPPGAWEARRRRVHQEGVVVEPAAWKSLARWAHRFSMDVPGPI
jgi:LDH2 family malate/lactate/ureidoglycolate dehydrogenase